jgi:hypothetical protein
MNNQYKIPHATCTKVSTGSAGGSNNAEGQIVSPLLLLKLLSLLSAAKLS